MSVPAKYTEMFSEKYDQALRSRPRSTKPWKEEARPEQLEPIEEYFIWLYLAGRGAGKTRTGAEICNEWANALPGSRGILVGRTASDVRNTMLEGESGLLTLYPELSMGFEPSKQRLTWPNGTVAQYFYAESPDTLRGPQGHWGWGDEVAAWQDAYKGDEKGTAFNNLILATRLGRDRGWSPRLFLSSTPKPVQLIVDLIKRNRVVVTSGSTYDNRDNLAPEFLQEILESYEGTRLAEQEIYGKLLLDSPAALWNQPLIDATRKDKHPNLLRVVVGVDPSASDSDRAAECGIIVVGLGEDRHFYVLADLSLRASALSWGKQVVLARRQFSADRVVAEKNHGGTMIEAVLRGIDPNLPYKAVTASTGKRTRAEPVASLFEQGRAHIVGSMAVLEGQLCGWEPLSGQPSPDRLDAMVWAITELMGAGVSSGVVHKRFDNHNGNIAEESERVRSLLGFKRPIRV